MSGSVPFSQFPDESDVFVVGVFGAAVFFGCFFLGRVTPPVIIKRLSQALGSPSVDRSDACIFKLKKMVPPLCPHPLYVSCKRSYIDSGLAGVIQVMQSWAVPKSKLAPDPKRALTLLLNVEASNVSYIRPSQVKSIVAAVRRKVPVELRNNLVFNVVEKRDLLTSKGLPKSLTKEARSANVTLYFVETDQDYRIVFVE